MKLNRLIKITNQIANKTKINNFKELNHSIFYPPLILKPVYPLPTKSKPKKNF